jgi:DNA-binding NarL/FixJ family response regulator
MLPVVSPTVIEMPRRAAAPAPVAPPVRVLLADGEWLVRAGLRAILDADDRIEVVGVAADRDAAIRSVVRLRPDVVVLDAGLEAAAPLREVVRGARLLLVTPHATDGEVLQALGAGAAGAVPKSAEPARLVEAVRTVAAGGTYLPPHLARKLLAVAEAGAEPHRPDPVLRRRFAQLSDRELEVVRLIARGYSNAEIAGELYLSEGTVKTYVTRTLGKLRLRSRVQVVVAAFDAGLVKPRERSVTAAR